MSALGSRTPLSRLRHDLRTPLNALIGYAEVLEEELEADAASALRAELRQVVASGHRLLGSMTQALSSSRRRTATSPRACTCGSRA